MFEYGPEENAAPDERLRRLKDLIARIWFGRYGLETERLIERHREEGLELADQVIELCRERASILYPNGIEQFRATFTGSDPDQKPIMQVDIFGDGEASFRSDADSYELVAGELAYYWRSRYNGDPYVAKITDMYDLGDFVYCTEEVLDRAPLLEVDIEPLDIRYR
jgi:hypothetical protein